jgi:hypothetical protein
MIVESQKLPDGVPHGAVVIHQKYAFPEERLRLRFHIAIV